MLPILFEKNWRVSTQSWWVTHSEPKRDTTRSRHCNFDIDDAILNSSTEICELCLEVGDPISRDHLMFPGLQSLRFNKNSIPISRQTQTCGCWWAS